MTVTEVNDKLTDEPAMVNTHAETDAWFVKVKLTDASQLGDLMQEDAYKEHCENESS